jgi:hypothetical protein
MERQSSWNTPYYLAHHEKEVQVRSTHHLLNHSVVDPPFASFFPKISHIFPTDFPHFPTASQGSPRPLRAAVWPASPMRQGPRAPLGAARAAARGVRRAKIRRRGWRRRWNWAARQGGRWDGEPTIWWMGLGLHVFFARISPKYWVEVQDLTPISYHTCPRGSIWTSNDNAVSFVDPVVYATASPIRIPPPRGFCFYWIMIEPTWPWRPRKRSGVLAGLAWNLLTGGSYTLW